MARLRTPSSHHVPPLSADECAASTPTGALQLPRCGHDLPAGQPAAAGTLQPEHIKEPPARHWGASPGLSFTYVHLNRLITSTT